MDISQKVEIHFHQQEQLSLFHESNATGAEEKLGEVALVAFYVLRTLCSLGQSQESTTLAQLLSTAFETVPTFANGSATGGFDLITYAGSQGRKRFLADIRLTDSNTSFNYKPKGFGIMGSGLGYYAPISTLAIIRYFSMKRAEDSEFLVSLAEAGATCGEAYLHAQVSMTNQLPLGNFIVAKACSSYLDEIPD